MDKMNLLELENVSLTFGAQSVLENLTLNIKKNKFLTVIGPNGAGKTSLIKLLIGIHKPTYGVLRKQPGLKISYVPQKVVCPVSFPMSVLEFFKTLSRVSRQKIQDSLESIGIGHLIIRQMKDISGGEMQKVLLARAILNKPDLMILDEPAANLDVNGQINFYQLINKAREQLSCSIIMVSHDLNMVMSTSDYVICLYRHVCCHGEPSKVVNEEAFVDLFGDEMGRLLLPYRHAHSHTHSEKDSCANPTEHNHS